jgi:hypothetical protein
MTAMKRFASAWLLALAACGGPPVTEGDPNDVVVVAAAERWAEMETTLRRAVERRVSGVPDEKVFNLVHQDPESDGWRDATRAPLVLVVGELLDDWVLEATASSEPRPRRPGLYHATDVWATGQLVNSLVVEGEEGEDLDEHLTALYAQLHADLRSYVAGRMFAAGADNDLADTLRAREGFGILPPRSFAFTEADSTFLFRAPPMDGEEEGVERVVAVTWMTPAPPSLELDEVLAWRASTARAHYGRPQEVIGRVTAERLAFAGYVALEIRGRWARRTEAGEREEGSLLTRVAVCEGQNRAYLLDSWVHTPGTETYQYVVALETILDTFRCE